MNNEMSSTSTASSANSNGSATSDKYQEQLKGIARHRSIVRHHILILSVYCRNNKLREPQWRFVSDQRGTSPLWIQTSSQMLTSLKVGALPGAPTSALTASMSARSSGTRATVPLRRQRMLRREPSWSSVNFRGQRTFSCPVIAYAVTNSKAQIRGAASPSALVHWWICPHLSVRSLDKSFPLVDI